MWVRWPAGSPTPARSPSRSSSPPASSRTATPRRTAAGSPADGLALASSRVPHGKRTERDDGQQHEGSRSHAAGDPEGDVEDQQHGAGHHHDEPSEGPAEQPVAVLDDDGLLTALEQP